MGFRDVDVRRGNDDAPIEDVVREGIALLT